MGKLIHIRKKRRRSRAVRPGYRSVGVRSVGRRAPSSPGFAGFINQCLKFLRRNYKLVALGGAVVVVAVVCIILFSGGSNTPVSNDVAEATPTPTPSESYALSEEDDQGGLSADVGDISEIGNGELEEGIRIGVTMGNVASSVDELVVNRIEEVAGEAVSADVIKKVYYYDAGGNFNQQLQDLRSLIKNEVDVIIAGFCDEKSFEMVTTLAGDAGIPVVAFDAPVQSGYAINIVADQSAWGSAYGKFMASKLASGRLVQILGSESSEIDQARASAITAVLAANANITASGTSYADWNGTKAKEAMAGHLQQGAVDGVITEEGMAVGVLNAFIDSRVLPKVMCGDATAGFIKKWYALKNGGVDVPSSAGGNETQPTTEKFAAQPGEFVVCAQPSPAGLGAVAFDIAVEMAKGRTLKQEGQTYVYAVSTMITDANLAEYYEKIKDKEDSYIVADRISAQLLDTLLNALEEKDGAATE